MSDDNKILKTSHIKKRINDAEFLIENQRYEAALLLILVAIDGSAIKVFPKGTQSINQPLKKRKGQDVLNEMSNSERYQRFLGVRLRQEMGFALPDSAFNAHSLPDLVSNHERPESVIYKAFRNNDVHESKIPEEYHYVYSEDGASEQMGVSFSNGEVKFNKGFLTLLKNVVVRADCNRVEFSSKYITLVNKDGLSLDEYIQQLSDKHDISIGRFRILFKIMHHLDEGAYSLSNIDLASVLNGLIAEHLPGGSVSGLSSATAMSNNPPIFKLDVGMTEDGVCLVREIKNGLVISES